MHMLRVLLCCMSLIMGVVSAVVAQERTACRALCAGDCNGDCVVTVDEVIRVMQGPPTVIPHIDVEYWWPCAMDTGQDGETTVDEIITTYGLTIHHALHGCER